MMKLTLALLAVGATASLVAQDDMSCYGDWSWDECAEAYWQEDHCTAECGWWYSPENDDDWWDD